MDPVRALERHGGVARRRELLGWTTRVELRAAVIVGDVVRETRGRYSLAATHEALRTANRVTGVLSHSSAALHWGWQVKTVPARPHVTVRRKRHLSAAQRQLIAPHWRDLRDDEVCNGVTSIERTVRDCLTDLPFDEALALADSVLRDGVVTPVGLATLAATSRRARRVAALADPRAANPFESALRAIALDVRGLHVTPQVPIKLPGLTVQPDLVDRERRVVLEADSHKWHSSRRALRRDCTRYNALVLDRWTVLRFTWEQVMFEPEHVRASLEEVVRLTDRQARRTKPGRRSE